MTKNTNSTVSETATASAIARWRALNAIANADLTLIMHEDLEDQVSLIVIDALEEAQKEVAGLPVTCIEDACGFAEIAHDILKIGTRHDALEVRLLRAAVEYLEKNRDNE